MRYQTSSGTKHWNNHSRFWMIMIITLLSCMLIAGCDVPGVSGNGNKNGVGNGNTGNCNGVNNCNTTNTPTSTGSSNTQTGKSVTPIQATPTPSPTPIPTPIPSPTPCHHCVVYRANWSNGLDGWTQSGGWSSINGMLINSGLDYNNDGHPTAIAPSLPQDITDYSVQAEIRLDRYTDEGGLGGEASFGVVVRSPDNVGGYKVGACVSAGIYSCGIADHEIILADGSFYGDTPVKQAPFRPYYGNWHTYRIDVQGNTITVWIDGGMVFQVTDDKFLSAGQVGLWSDRCQISIRNFTITAL